MSLFTILLWIKRCQQLKGCVVVCMYVCKESDFLKVLQIPWHSFSLIRLKRLNTSDGFPQNTIKRKRCFSVVSQGKGLIESQVHDTDVHPMPRHADLMTCFNGLFCWMVKRKGLVYFEEVNVHIIYQIEH